MRFMISSDCLYLQTAICRANQHGLSCRFVLVAAYITTTDVCFVNEYIYLKLLTDNLQLVLVLTYNLTTSDLNLITVPCF